MFESIIPLNIGVSSYMPTMYFPESSELAGGYDGDSLLKSHIKLEFEHYTMTLLENPLTWNWFLARGVPITPELIKRFRLGFADNSFGKKLSRKYGRKSEVFRGSMQRAGLYKSTGRPFFHGDMVFPFVSHSGDIEGAYGRRISSENRSNKLYHRHWNLSAPTFFNVGALNTSKTLVLAKTAFEAINFVAHGVENAVGTMGIYSFSEKHLEMIVHCDPHEVVLAYDNSDEGNHVSGIIAQCLNAEDVFCSRLPLPRNHDVNLYLQRYGDKAHSLAHLIENRIPYSQSYENLVER